MENEKDKKLIITPLDENTKKLSQVLANDTCRKILNLIADESLTSSQISEKLSMPLTTIESSINRLERVSLITVHHRRWSPKGKKVNYYAPAEKYILIAPKAQPDKIFKALESLLPAVGILAVISGALDFLFNGMKRATVSFSQAAPVFDSAASTKVAEKISENVTETLPYVAKGAEVQSSAGAASAASGVPAAAAEMPHEFSYMAPKAQSFLLQHPGILIFIIGVIVILAYAVYKYKYAK